MSSLPIVGTVSPVNPIASPLNSSILGANTSGAMPAGSGLGGTGAGAHSLSMNLGGLNVNYDLGPSVSTVASQAMQFVGQSFGSDAALLGNTISDTQGWLGAFVNPIVAGVANQQQVNAANLPGLYSTLLSDNLAIGTGSIQANIANAQASIASSNASAAASNSGGCFITGAVCEGLGLPDDCTELRALRAFRDTYMQETAERRAMVQDYYAIAPGIVAKLANDPDKMLFFERARNEYILPAVRAIIDSRPADALELYGELVSYARSYAHKIASAEA